MNCVIRRKIVQFDQHDNGLDLTVKLPVEDSIVGIFGPSGSGKSTLLNVIAGTNEHQFDNEVIQFGQQDWREVVPEKRPFVLVSDKTPLFPHLNVLDNLMLVVRHGEFSDTAVFTLDDVVLWCGIEHLTSRQPSDLSSGEIQRVKFARGLLSGKSIILLDEAFSALDWASRCRFSRLLVWLNQELKIKFITVSHSLKELALCCDHIVWIEQGGITQSGPSDEVIAQISSSDGQPTISQLKVASAERLEEHDLWRWQLKANSELSIFSHLNLASEKANESKQQKYLVLEGDKIVLSLVGDTATSMVNQLPGVINRIRTTNRHVLIELDVSGQVVLARITSLSQQRMRLTVGQKIFAQFKVL